MSLVATVANPLSDPVPAGWDAFAARHRLPPVWYSSLIRALDWCGQTASSMVLVHEATSGEPVALFRARTLGIGLSGRFVPAGRRPVVGLAECRVESTLAPGIAFAGGIDHRDRVEACRVFERALLRAPVPGQRVVWYRNLADDHLAVVPARRRVRSRSGPVMVLPNQWPDLPSYLAGLPSKWRSRLKKVHAGVEADTDLDVTLVDSIEADEACWLAEVVRRRHRSLPVPRPPRPACYFREFARLAGSRFLTYRDAGGRLIAYSGFWDDGRDLTLIWWGARAPRDGGRENLYFDQCLRLVDEMLRTGRRRIVLGAGLTEVKARYGARPRARWGLVGPW